jgi:hypothetical protein
VAPNLAFEIDVDGPSPLFCEGVDGSKSLLFLLVESSTRWKNFPPPLLLYVWVVLDVFSRFEFFCHLSTVSKIHSLLLSDRRKDTLYNSGVAEFGSVYQKGIGWI